MTKREMFEYIRSQLSEDEQVVTFCNEQIQAINSKVAYGNKRRKAKADEVNAVLDKRIVEVLINAENPMTCKEIAEALGDVAYPKVTPRLATLVGQGKLEKGVFDLKYVYSIAK